MALTIYSLIQRNGSDALTGLIEDVTQYSPEYSQIPVVARAGITYKTLSRTGLPNAGFRLANQGISASNSTYDSRLHEMYFVDTPLIVDEAIYKGDDGVTGDVLYQEGQGGLQATLNEIAYQTYYGAANDGSNGFVGLRAQLLPTGSGLTAVTASAAANTSTVYGLWLNVQGVHYDIGKYGEIGFPPFQRQFVSTNTTATNSPSGFWAYVSNISCYIGLGVGSLYSVFGVTGVSLAAPFTDALALSQMIQVPLTRRAGFTWFMNKTAYGSLQKSRTSINYQPAGARSGTPAWSPPPLECEGYPIVLTEAITNTENNA
jgi:hypothetical protein